MVSHIKGFPIVYSYTNFFKPRKQKLVNQFYL